MIYISHRLCACGQAWSKLFAAAVISLVVFSSHAGAEETDMSAADLIKIMKEGGNVLFFRHATTEKDYADQVTAKLGDCSTQRMLSEAGWKEAKKIGALFKRQDIPVHKVISSEYCRAWQTADLAFGEYEKSADLNFEPAEDYTEEQTKAMRDRMVPLLSKAPEAGSNTVLVGHDDPFEAATGIYPEPMGVVFVLKPKDGKFEVLGSIAPDQWPNDRG
jgi:phosphohistidine phosphatase SixA